ncbi:parallel beta-helix domain-containing protein [Flavihumibacter sp. UBA7668]|uniref:parallel beta-helix domain-containing protein n=1 Tax=Flavihumibacter sp. UBA7668 TaxID=1946542 RepID=UPI0025BF3CCE|nr:parallel beta-helix domain-containing protein [Flavihumibacter sp. UBA7668]
MKKTSLLFILSLLAIAASAQQDIQRKLQTQLIEVENNGIVLLPEGTYFLTGTLSMDGKQGVTIRGKGRDKTILNFANQISGAEGIKITNGSNIRLENLTVQNTKGDAIKTQLVDGIHFLQVKTEWTRGANSSNGGYGIYPVQCQRVLIDSCYARGASDAGIYVGQSHHIIVRNSIATENVAGIEIENSLYAEVHNNEAFNNTGGILVFDLPDLIVKKGGFTKLYNNQVYENNHVNFAPKGNIVGKVPPGTGIMVLAANNVDIYENRISNNRTAGTVVVSYYITENPINDSTYYPYPSNIYIHGNVYERKKQRATMKGRMGKLFRFKLRFGKNVPHIIYDGIHDEKAVTPNQLCIQNNQGESFANIDAANGFKKISRDMKGYNCALNIPVTINLQ